MEPEAGVSVWAELPGHLPSLQSPSGILIAQELVEIVTQTFLLQVLSFILLKSSLPNPGLGKVQLPLWATSVSSAVVTLSTGSV